MKRGYGEDARFADHRDQPPGEGRKALQAAVDAGVNVIHSSDSYEKRSALTDVFRDIPNRHELHHIIKVNTPDYHEEGFNPDVFVETIERALRVLVAERIDIVQHLQRGPKMEKEHTYSVEGDLRRIEAMPVIVEDTVAIFEKMRDQGKVRYLATFPHTFGFAKEAIGTGKFHGLVHFLNLLETEMERRGMGYIAIRPLLQGMLTDKRINRKGLPKDDRKLEGNWDQWYAKLDAVREELNLNPESWTDFALKFTLAHPLVTTLVVGLNTPQQVQEVVAACDGNYPDADMLNQVNEISKRFGFVPKDKIFG